MLERNQAADDRLLPDGQADAVTVLQRESGFFIGETELLRLRPHGGDLGVVRPGRTSSIAASRYSRQRL
jgi:hypothetical protein